MSAQKRYDVFLSHNSKDKPLIEIIAEQLREDSLEVWLDKGNLDSGDSFPDEIQQAIENSKAVLFCIGSHGLGKWQKLEMNACRVSSVDGKLKIFTIILPSLENLPDGSEYVFLRQEIYLKWDGTNFQAIDSLIASIYDWLPVWTDKELKRLTVLRCDAEKKLQEIELKIQQVESEGGIELDPERQRASKWLSDVRNHIERYARRALQNFPKLWGQIEASENGFKSFCNEMDICLEFVYFSFRKRDKFFLHNISINLSVLGFSSEDAQENREVYHECLNVISSLIPIEEINESTRNELTSYFSYLWTQILSLI
jgi:hypothetical protein